MPYSTPNEPPSPLAFLIFFALALAIAYLPGFLVACFVFGGAVAFIAWLWEIWHYDGGMDDA